MPKRFTETAKWDDPWFDNLSPDLKLFWVYLCDRCDSAGVWDPNERLASYHLGEKISLQNALERLAGRVSVLSSGKWHLTGFVRFQYPRGLNPTSKPQADVIRRLESHGIPVDVVSPNLNPSSRVGEGLPKGSRTLQDQTQTRKQTGESAERGAKSKAITDRESFAKACRMSGLACNTDDLIEEWAGVGIRAGAAPNGLEPKDWSECFRKVKAVTQRAREINGMCRFPNQAECAVSEIRQRKDTA